MGALFAELSILGELVSWNTDLTKYRYRLLTVLKLKMPGICIWHFENTVVNIFNFYAILDLSTHNTSKPLSTPQLAPKLLCGGS